LRTNSLALWALQLSWIKLFGINLSTKQLHHLLHKVNLSIDFRNITGARDYISFNLDGVEEPTRDRTELIIGFVAAMWAPTKITDDDWNGAPLLKH
jgi:hypothetical protein